MRFAPHEQSFAHQAIVADAHGAGTVNGTGVAVAGYGECLVVVNSGTNGATGTVDITVEESDTLGSGYAAISGAAFTQITTSNDNAMYVGRIRLGGRDKYIRAVAVVANATCDFSVSFMLSEASLIPVTQTNTVAFNITA